MPVEINEVPVEKPVNNTGNITISISLSMPGHPVLEDTVVIRNAKGSLLGSQRRPEVYMETLKDKIR